MSAAFNYRPALDRLRWVSAFVVAFGHALGILNDHAHGSRVLTVAADMRGPSVLVFFALSGYLIGGLVMRDVERFDFRRYAISRFSRIYIVLLPALLLTVLIDGAVLWLDPKNPLFSSSWQGGALGTVPVFARYGSDSIIASLFCLEPLLGRPIGSAASLWSLGNEWIYYFAFPALFWVGNRMAGSRGAAILAFSSVGALYLISKNEAGYWLVWLLGAYANAVDREVFRSELLRRALKYAALAGCAAAVTFGSLISRQGCLAAIAVSAFVFFATGPATAGVMTHKLDQMLARISYSLYVTHLQAMTLLAAVFYRLGILPADGVASPWEVLRLSLGMVGLCIAIAAFMATAFEDRTQALSQWLGRKIPHRILQFVP
jgi:peptidoglycan/LPS O-acetylase OafA/YrhL